MLDFFFLCPSESRNLFHNDVALYPLHGDYDNFIVLASQVLRIKPLSISVGGSAGHGRFTKSTKHSEGGIFLIKFLHHPLIASIFPLLQIFSQGLHPLDSFGSEI